MAITVLVADSQRLLAEALGRCLAGYSDLEVLDDHPTAGVAALEAIVSLRPNVAVLDYWMGDVHAPAAVRTMLAWVPGQKVILMSWLHGPDQIQASLDAGAVGFLPKSVTVDQVAEAVRRAHAGDCPVFKDELERLVERLGNRVGEQEVRVERLLTLTPREVTILRALSSGRPLQEAAAELSITLSTLRTHIHSILTKTGARSQVEALAMARREGLVRD